MSKPEFRQLERALLAADVSPRYVYRTIEELRDHFDDIESAAIAAGREAAEARDLARDSIGRDDAIIAEVTSRTELLRWPRRWPRVARVAYTLCYYALLPAAPVIYCTRHGSAIARWSAAASLAALVTGAMLLSMRWFIV